MTHFQLPNESFQYTYAAHEEAQKAAIQANYGYRNKLAFYEKESILRRWKELMVNAPILLHNVLFILFAVADMIISWEMLRDVVSNSAISPSIQWIAIFVFCLLINAWAAVTAHFIGRGWSAEIQDWERWNFIFIKNRNQSPVNIIGDEMRREKIKARFWAVISGVILIGLVGAIIYYRNTWQVAGDEALIDFESEGDTSEQSDPAGLTLILTYLPLAIIIGELFTGDYFWYSIRRIQTVIGRNRAQKRFLKHKEQCGRHDKLAVQYTQVALNNPTAKLEIVGDLNNAHLRFKFRSQQSDDYIDPLDNFKKFGFCFRYRGSGKPLANVAVFGVLPNGAKTGDHKTDEEGKVTIPIEGDFDRLISIGILNREYLGPFQASGEHFIDLPEILAEATSLNGQS